MVTFSQRQKISCMKLITADTGQMYHNAAVALQSLHALVAKKKYLVQPIIVSTHQKSMTTQR